MNFLNSFLPVLPNFHLEESTPLATFVYSSVDYLLTTLTILSNNM